MAKKPTKATTPEAYIAATVRTGEVAAAKGSPTNPQAMSEIARLANYVYAAVDRKSSVIAGCSPMVYRKARNGRKGKRVDRKTLDYLRSSAVGKAAMWAKDDDDIEKVPDHPLLRLLQKPNPHQSGSEFAQLDAMFLESSGNSYWHIVGPKGRAPSELWTMAPQYTKVIPSKDGLVSGYFYGRDVASADRMDVDEVSHARLANPFDPYYGLSPIRAIMASADIYAAGDQHELALIDNQARPDYAWIVKNGAAPKEVIENIEQKLNARHRGVAKRGKHIVLTGDVTLSPLQWSPKELQWIEQQKWNRDTIATAFGVPVSLLSVENVNLANAQEGMTQFLRLSILPRLCILADRMTNDILPLFGDEPGDAWVTYENPVPEDQVFIRDRNVTYVTSGIITPNEARMIEGMDAIEGGDALRSGVVEPVGEVDAEIVAAPVPTYDPARGTAILDVLAKVQGGILAPEAATAFLVGVIGMDQANAAAMVAAQVTVIAEPETDDGSTGGSEGAGNADADDGDKPGSDRADGDADGKSARGAGQPGAGDSGGIAGAGDAGEVAARHASLKAIWAGTCACCKDAPPPSDEYSEGTPTGEPEGELPQHPEPPSRFVKELRGYFDDQKDAALAAMDDKPLAIKGIAEAIIEWGLASSGWDVKLLSTVRSSLDSITSAGAAQAVNELLDMVGEKPIPSTDFDVDDPHYVEAFNRDAGRFVTSVNEETEKQIRLALQAGVESGENIQQLKDRIASVFDLAPERAEAIARTETARFNGLGRIEQMRQTGVPMKKRWLLAGGACELCRAIAKRGDIGIDGTFWGLGETVIGTEGTVYTNDYAPVVSAPAHPNDRCMAIFVVDKAWLEGSA